MAFDFYSLKHPVAGKMLFAALLVASALNTKTCCQKENPQNLLQSGEQQKKRWAGESSCIFQVVSAADNKRRFSDAAKKKGEKKILNEWT